MPQAAHTEEAACIIEQITNRKLIYAREFLSAYELARTGTKPQIRERLTNFLAQRPDEVQRLKLLLDELDAWGNQRIRIGRISDEAMAGFRSKKLVVQKIRQAGLEHLIGGHLPVTPPLNLSPMRVSYDEDSSLLMMYAAKTRIVLQPQQEIPDKVDEENYPGVLFKPYKQEAQKAVSFAEIDLRSGLTIISTTLLKQGFAYKAEFEEFYELFESLISFEHLTPVELYAAIHNIRYTLPAQEVRIRTNKKRTSSGGTIHHSSHSSKIDLRNDPELVRSEEVLTGLSGLHCNCYWEAVNGLAECVHTHVFAPSGEISIMGQVKEESARYVLQRILSLN